MTVLLVAVAGALGALARWGTGALAHALLGQDFPWGTLTVNIVGSFLIGFAFRTFEASAVAPEIRSAVIIGFLGAFTTFSAFSLESMALLESGQWGRALLYVAGGVASGILAAAAGVIVAGGSAPA